MVHQTLIRFGTGSIPATATGPSFNGRTVHLQCTDRGSIPLGSTNFLFFYKFVRVSEETQYDKKPTLVGTKRYPDVRDKG